jgi:hypothetical protein
MRRRHTSKHRTKLGRKRKKSTTTQKRMPASLYFLSEVLYGSRTKAKLRNLLTLCAVCPGVS